MCGTTSDSHKILGKRLNQSQGWHPKSKIGISTSVMRCTFCGLVYANPQPVPYTLQDHYGIPLDQYWIRIDSDRSDDYFKEELRQTRILLPFSPGARALDIGTGHGKVMVALREAGFDAYGIEPSKPFYAWAIEKMNLSPARLKLTTIEDAEFPEQFFDFITFGAVLEHLYDPSKAIQKALKWLKPSGVMHIEVPSSDWLISKLANLFFRISGTDYVTNISPMHKPFHLYEFTLKSFVEHGRQNSYEIAFYRYYVCPTYVLQAVEVILRPIMRWTNTGMQIALWLRKKAKIPR
jgi:2-polyprenyl-3-methyl-5-hydroxy-6-metoxy-1,4-benzoquinol methylase